MEGNSVSKPCKYITLKSALEAVPKVLYRADLSSKEFYQMSKMDS
jgi:hypothetical protein